MVRIAKKTDPKKIKELKQKINDEKYISRTIVKIAQDLTRELASGD